MSEKVSQALITILNEITNIEIQQSKVQAAIYIKTSEQIMKGKISYLYNLLQTEANQSGQNPEKHFNTIDRIMNKYREKLEKVYDELYLQYINIQNEIGDARLNQKAAMINYQKVVNDSKRNNKNYDNLKLKIKLKNEIYENIIERCNQKFSECIGSFEKYINNNFYIESGLKVVNGNNIFEKIKNKILNFFNGKNKYEEILINYEAKVDNIDTEKIVKDLREKTVDFVTDILEIKDINLEEAV